MLSFLIKPPAENRHHSGLHRVRVNQNIKRTGNPRKYMDVSENNGIPKSSILIGFSIINHPFWGNTPLFLETSIWKLRNGRTLQFDLGQKAQRTNTFLERFLVGLFFLFFGEVFWCQHIRGIDLHTHSSCFKEKSRLKYDSWFAA